MKKKPTASDTITVEELLKPEKSSQKRHLSQIREVPIELIDDFQERPFQVKIDEDMDRLVESVRTNGIITPVTLREKPNGRYEIISGHRRKKACEIAGLSTVKAEIRTLDRDEAVILMVDSNLQRSVILPSEKAWSYKMRLDAMNRQGQRKSTSAPVEQKYSSEILADQTGESQAQIYRYVRLTKLLPELLTMVDQRRIAFHTAVELSYLTEKEQRALLEAILRGGSMSFFEYYLIIINAIGFILFAINTWLYSNTAEGQVDKFLTITSLLGGSLGILLSILVFDRKAVKENMMSRVFIACIFVIQVVIFLALWGVHGERLTFAFREFFSKYKILLIYLVIINFVSLAVFAVDKIAAIEKRSRIRIITLLGLCFIGGSLGGLAAMYLFHHKTKKDNFTVGVPLIIVMQIIVTLYLMNL